MTGTISVWARADWCWSMPAIGFEISAYLGSDAPRWFKLQLRLLFLWLSLNIEAPDREEFEEQDE